MENVLLAGLPDPESRLILVHRIAVGASGGSPAPSLGKIQMGRNVYVPG